MEKSNAEILVEKSEIIKVKAELIKQKWVKQEEDN